MLSIAMGVSIRPGMIALARIPCLALPPANDSVSEFTAAFTPLCSAGCRSSCTVVFARSVGRSGGGHVMLGFLSVGP